MDVGGIAAFRLMPFDQRSFVDGSKFNSLSHPKKPCNLWRQLKPTLENEAKKFFIQTLIAPKNPSKFPSTPNLRADPSMVGVHSKITTSGSPEGSSVKRMVLHLEGVSAMPRLNGYTQVKADALDRPNGYTRVKADTLDGPNGYTRVKADTLDGPNGYTRVKADTLDRPKRKNPNVCDVTLDINCKRLRNAKLSRCDSEKTFCGSIDDRLDVRLRNGFKVPSNLSSLIDAIDSGDLNDDASFWSESGRESPSRDVGHIKNVNSVPPPPHRSGGTDGEPTRDIWIPLDPVPVRELNSKPTPVEAVGGPKEAKSGRPAERRESGRLQSAARILRSLGRSRDEESRGPDREARGPNRSNPNYHSEGKGANKALLGKKVERPTHKERSKSFCEKPDSKKGFTPTKHHSKRAKKEASHLHQDGSPGEITPSQSPLPESSSVDNQPYLPSPGCNAEKSEGGNAPTKLGELQSSTAGKKPSGGGRGAPKREHRICRKLTKDSGYETSPYSEGDYAVLTPNVKPEEGTDVVAQQPHERDLSEPSSCCHSEIIDTPVGSTLSQPELKDPVHRFPSAESLSTFAESLLAGSPPPSPSEPPLARSFLALWHCGSPAHPQEDGANVKPSKSTPNLDGADIGRMVTKKVSMYSDLERSPTPSRKRGFPASSRIRDAYWDMQLVADDGFHSQSNHSNHLRSSYQIIHSHPFSSGSYHFRQPSTYSEDETPSVKSEILRSAPRFRCASFDSLGDGGVAPTSGSWNVSEPDLNLTQKLSSSFSKFEKGETPRKVSEDSPKKNPSSPPPPPVRDASSLKYIRYGPGHEKYPSWPVPAGDVGLPPNIGVLDTSVAYLSSQGSHRSHSWTEQSEYPKEKCGGYARPFLKRQCSPSFQKQLLTVMEKCEKISPDIFEPYPTEELLMDPDYPLMDPYLQQSIYFPMFDSDGRAIDDKDYCIPSPPERDLGLGEAHLSQVTMAQLEEHARRCDLAYGDPPSGEFPQITPLLDQLRHESYTWDGASERDSGRGESESFTDSRYTNGRDSVTTVVTNSSSASSSETLKWQGSFSDISVMSGNSRESKVDHNIVRSSRVQTPQKHNSESVYYYSKGKPLRGQNRDNGMNVRRTENGYLPNYKESLWNREVERNNEMNDLKKFPSFSYTQPLSQIKETPAVEPSDSSTSRYKSPVIDTRKPMSVAERIHALERQSRGVGSCSSAREPRDHSEPRDVRRFREERFPSIDSSFLSSSSKMSSERDLRQEETSRKSSGSSPLSTNCVIRRKSSGSSCNRRLSVESVLSSDSERSTGSTSYSYLDPEKRCRVPDFALKNIQKQALLSFYERRTGKALNTQSSHIPSKVSPNLQQVRRTTPDGKMGKGMAKLGRVPEPESEVVSKSTTPSGEVGDPSPTAPSAIPEVSEKPDVTANLVEVNRCNASLPAPLERLNVFPSQEQDKFSSSSANGGSSTPPNSPGDFRSSSPSSTNPPPKPPERPPKKPNLRSLFKNLKITEQDKGALTPFKKPPAPDPPSPTPPSPPPPPPPALEEEVVISDEPLPPPPAVEMPPPPSRSASTNNISGLKNGTYHKDSYMAHRKDWNSGGCEGSYRRTQSPTAAERNLANGHGGEHLINSFGGHHLKITSPSAKPSVAKNKPSGLFKNSNLRSAVSASSLLRKNAPMNSDLFNHSMNDNEFSYNYNNNNKTHDNNNWITHPRLTSTTVEFTAEELKAFRAQQAAVEARSNAKNIFDFRCYDPLSFPAPERGLMRAVSVGEPLHRLSQEHPNADGVFESSPSETPSEYSSSSTLTSVSTMSSANSSDDPHILSSPAKRPSPHSSPVPHDGPITAHPATVTEEEPSTPHGPLSSISSESLLPLEISEVLVTSQSLASPNPLLTPPHHKGSSPSLNESSLVLVSTSSLGNAFGLSSPSRSLTSLKVSPLLRRLSSTGTNPSMTPADVTPEEDERRKNVVVLGFGRTVTSEERACDDLAAKFLEKNCPDRELINLLAPGHQYKSTATYMEGIFTLEMRHDLLCSFHAKHPDLVAASARNSTHSTGKCSERAMVTRGTRNSPSQKCLERRMGRNSDKIKEELIAGVERKLEVLRRELNCLKEDTGANNDLGEGITAAVEARARESESAKYKLQVEEIDKIAALLLGLAGRLAKAENSLSRDDHEPEEKIVLERKRDKLRDQLEEAKRLKENIDRRAELVSFLVSQYLKEEEYAEYDHFTKMKVKLLMDVKETEEKLLMGEEQLEALKRS